MPKLIKIFTTSELPEDIYNFVQTSDIFQELEIGAFVLEASKNPEEYDAISVEESKKADDWFISQGVAMGERIIIRGADL